MERNNNEGSQAWQPVHVSRHVTVDAPAGSSGEVGRHRPCARSGGALTASPRVFLSLILMCLVWGAYTLSGVAAALGPLWTGP